jgi:hypothetical protein
MIRIEPQPEPDVFDNLVREPGNAFVLTTPNPTSKQFEKHPYWREVLPQIRTLYSNICAYSCFYVPAATGSNTIEHFKPKSHFPDLAYEWSNYRFVSQKLNGKKGVHQDVIDPFLVEHDSFVIEFPSLLVKPNDRLDSPKQEAVLASITRLRLNDEGTCLEQRTTYTRNYCLGRMKWRLLKSDAPFLAREVARQGFITTLNDIMQYPLDEEDEFDRLIRLGL